MTRCFTLMAVTAAVALGCSDPEPAPTTPVDIEEPEAPSPEGDGPSELPLPRLAAVPGSSPPWIGRVAEQCAHDDPHACWLLGAVHTRGLLGEPDPERAHALYARACQGEGGFGCAELAALSEPANRGAHLTRGCEAGRADSCAALAESLEESDASAATTARMRACSLGDPEVCLPVPDEFPHDMTAPPEGTPTEESRVPAGADETVRGIAQRCDQGMAAMCAWLSLQYAFDNDFGLEQDGEHALDLAARSCNDDSSAGCTQLGMLLIGQMEEDPEAGRTAGTSLGRACAAGIGVACAANATVFTRFPTLRALTITTRFEACVLGDQESCELQ